MESGQRIICNQCGSEQRINAARLRLQRPNVALPAEAFQVTAIFDGDFSRGFRPSRDNMTPEQADLELGRYVMMQRQLAFLYVRVDSPLVRTAHNA
jgi:hypothetical protein